MKKIVLTGGGTGGHITPHLAVIPKLNENGFKTYYIGSEEGMEKDIMKKIMPYYSVTTCKLKRKLDFSNLLIPFKLIKGVLEAKKILKEIKPDIIFSKGGFVAVPVVLAAHSLKIPVITHESDYSLGLANKIIKNKCYKVCTSFENLAKNLKNGYFTGSPVRKELLNGNKQIIMQKYNFDDKKPNVLFIGGSLGSKTINEKVFKGAERLCKNYNIIHLVGKNNINNNVKIPNYVQIEFVENIKDLYAFSDIVVTRGGSNVLFELLALKKPMLIIPLSKKESRGDQLLNAEYFKEKGYANVLLEENLTVNTLEMGIEKTFSNKNLLKGNMKADFKNGTDAIVDLIVKTVKNKEKI